MTCADQTTNNRPVGVGYNSRGTPIGLSELTDISVSNVSAAESVNTNTIVPLTGGTVTVVGTLSATDYLNIPAVAGATALADLTDDVAITTPAIGQTLEWNGTHWVNTTPTTGITNISDADDVQLGTLSTSDALVWNGTHWVNAVLPTTLEGLTDTYIVTGDLANGHLLVWNNSLSRWINTPSGDLITTGGVTDHGALTGLADNDHPHYQLSTSLSNNLLSKTFPTDSFIYFSGPNTAGSAAITSFGRSLVNQSTALATRNYIGLSALATKDSILISDISEIDGSLVAADPYSLLRVNLSNDALEFIPGTTYVESTGGTYASNFVFNNISATNISATTYSGISLSGTLKDVLITGIVTGQYLTWNGSKWVNGTITVPSNLDALSDVDTRVATNGQVLTYQDGIWYGSSTPSVRNYSNLTSIVDKTWTADSYIYFSAENAAAIGSSTSYGRSILQSTSLTPFIQDTLSIEDLTDVTHPTTPAENEILVYTDDIWQNKPITNYITDSILVFSGEGTPVTGTATTGVTTIFSADIPAGTLGANDYIDIDVMFYVHVSGYSTINCYASVYWGNATGTTLVFKDDYTIASGTKPNPEIFKLKIYNNNSTASQGMIGSISKFTGAYLGATGTGNWGGTGLYTAISHDILSKNSAFSTNTAANTTRVTFALNFVTDPGSSRFGLLHGVCRHIALT